MVEKRHPIHSRPITCLLLGVCLLSGFGIPSDAAEEISLEPILQSLEALNAAPENQEEIFQWLQTEQELRNLDAELEFLEAERKRLESLRENLQKKFPPATSVTTSAGELSLEDLEYFETHIRPALIENCFGCHGAEKQKGGLRLDNSESFLRGGDSGPVVYPGDPEGSSLLKALEYQDPSLQMPPSGKLSENLIESFREWIRRGAPFPKSDAPTLPEEGFDLAEARKFWSFQPVGNPQPPEVAESGWIAQPIDAFVLQRMREAGLSPAAEAEKRTLLRRVTYDLTGLPPTPEEVEAFLADSSGMAFEKVVDRLLESPAYGERWGRHWLDVVRYTDSFDSRAAIEQDVGESYRYRDWVVQAFNEDMPYDRFLRYQIAGDLLPPRGSDTPGFNREGIIATGVMAIGNWPGGDADKEKMVTDIVDDQIDLVTRGMMGLTVACARCHDHKFDPVTTEDYYGLAGIFFSSHILPGPGRKTEGSPVLRIPLLPQEELEKRQAAEARMAAIQAELDAHQANLRKTRALATLSQSSDYLIAARTLWNSRKTDSPSFDEFQISENLSKEALEGWMRYLGFQKERPMTRQVAGIHDKPGLHAWMGAQDAASLTVNTNEEEVSYLTIIQPGHSVAVHPSPQNAVKVSWTCPEEGVYAIEGGVQDLDSTCGDGVGWSLSLESDSGERTLCQGGFINGGKELFANAAGSDALLALSMAKGDRLKITISPKSGHACDTTLIDLSITGAADPDNQKWNLARDLLDHLSEENPTSKKEGQVGLWTFFESTEEGGAGKGGEAVLKNWEQRIGEIVLNRGAEETLEAAVEQAAHSVGEALTAHAALNATAQSAAADTPIGLLFGDLISENSPFPFAFDSGDLPEAEREKWELLNTELEGLRSQPRPPIEYANGIQEGGVPDTPLAGIQDVPVHIRGRYDRLGELVPRRFPVVLTTQEQPEIDEGSGRVQLANWVASASNPLTARVLVNRVWQHHFGKGLVRTPGNFGSLGEKPTHPALVDWLARDFIQKGWSVKKLHRRILLSSTYRQSSNPSSLAAETDPDNLWLSHQNRRRLEAEAIRDAILCSTNRLDPTLGGPPFRDLSTPRRTLYFKTVRSDRTSFNMLFDAADPTAIVNRRLDTTVAPQALFLLNNPFVLENASILAEKVCGNSDLEDPGRIKAVYEKLYSRPPLEKEVDLGLSFLSGAEGNPIDKWTRYCQILLCANEFIYLD